MSSFSSAKHCRRVSVVYFGVIAGNDLSVVVVVKRNGYGNFLEIESDIVIEVDVPVSRDRSADDPLLGPAHIEYCRIRQSHGIRRRTEINVSARYGQRIVESICFGIGICAVVYAVVGIRVGVAAHIEKHVVCVQRAFGFESLSKKIGRTRAGSAL